MKIGFFTDTYYPQINGVVTSTLILKENLERLGHKVYVFTTTDAKEPQGERDVYRIPSIPIVSEKRLGLFYQPRLIKIIKGLNLDIIHTHTEFSLGIFGRMIANDLNIPLIHTYHTIYEDYTHYIVKFPKLDPLAKVAARKISTNFCNSTSRVVVPTTKVRDLLLSYGVKRDLTVIATGINMNHLSACQDYFHSRQRLRSSMGLKDGNKVILYVGRLSKEKNISELLINLHEYLKMRTELKFVLIGDGPETNDLKNLANKLNLNEQVIFAGAKPWHSIMSYYHIGDVFVSASQSETQGITYIEALASGLPIVVKSDPCLEGVVIEGVNGYTFNKKDEFVKTIDVVLYDEQQREKLSNGAVQSVEKFSSYHFAKNIEDLYINELFKSKSLLEASSI